MQKSKINILHLVNGFAIGGAERKLLELVRYLDRKRFNVIVAGVGQSGPLKKDFSAAADKVYVIEKKHKYDFSQILRVASILKRHKIDIIQNTMFYADIIGTFAAKLAGTSKVISWEVSSHPQESHESQFRHIFSYKLAMKYVNRIVAVSEAVKQWLVAQRQIPEEKIQTIHYGIDLSKFDGMKGHSCRQEFGIGDDEVVLGTVARLTTQKGHTYLLSAAAEIVKRFPKVRFVFLGDGPLRTELEDKTRQLNLENHVRYLGFRTDVAKWLKSFDIFILPSLFEGLPNAVLEAMASEKPVIATSVDGTPEAVVDQVTGLLIPPRDPEAIVQSALTLIADKGLRENMGKNGRKRAEEYFDNNRQFEKFVSLYHSLLE